MFRRIAAALTSAALLISVAASSVAAGGPPNLAFYVDDVRYRTVGTPTDFSNTGAPASTYDRIYALGSGLVNVAEAKPGDRDFNGGRWEVHPIQWNTIAPTQFMNDTDILTAAQAGQITILAPICYFFCSVSPVPPSWS